MSTTTSDEEDMETLLERDLYERADDSDEYFSNSSRSQNEESDSQYDVTEEVEYEELITSIFQHDESNQILQEKGARVLGKKVQVKKEWQPGLEQTPCRRTKENSKSQRWQSNAHRRNTSTTSFRSASITAPTTNNYLQDRDQQQLGPEADRQHLGNSDSSDSRKDGQAWEYIHGESSPPLPYRKEKGKVDSNQGPNHIKSCSLQEFNMVDMSSSSDLEEHTSSQTKVRKRKLHGEKKSNGKRKAQATWKQGEGSSQGKKSCTPHMQRDLHFYNFRDTTQAKVHVPTTFLKPTLDVRNTIPLPAKKCRAQKRQKIDKRGSWSNESLQLAISAIEDGHKLKNVSDFYNIPRTTIMEHACGKRKSTKRGRQGILTIEEENGLVDYLDNMLAWGHPLTPRDLKDKVAEMVQGRPNPFTNGIPGPSWLKWFRVRHPQFSLRVAQGLEVNRAIALCPENVNTFYDNLVMLYEENKYTPHQIWNVDESGAQAGKGGAKVLARKGTRVVHSLIANERESLTVLSAINAGGETIPNFYIFKGILRMRDYLELCEANSTMGMQPNAWMTAFLFSKWIDHFIVNIAEKGGMSTTKRHLMILDGHNSHVTLDVLTKAKEAGLDICSLPSHTSHALQPLDVAVFKPFKTAFKAYRDIWTMQHKGEKIRKEDLAQWVSLGLQKAMTASNIRAGFAATGIWPLNPKKLDQKMKPSEGFIEKPLEVQIQEILEEEVLCTQDDVVHYYVDEEGECTFEDQVTTPEVPAGTSGGHFSTFLRLPQQVTRPRKNILDPRIDYSKSHVLTSSQHIQAIHALANKKAKAIEETQKRKKDKELTKVKKSVEKAEMEAAKVLRQKERAAQKKFKELWSNKAIREAGERLYRSIKEGKGAGQTIAPYCGFQPLKCKSNQRIAIARLKAKRSRKEYGTPLPQFPPIQELPWTYGSWRLPHQLILNQGIFRGVAVSRACFTAELEFESQEEEGNQEEVRVKRANEGVKLIPI